MTAVELDHPTGAVLTAYGLGQLNEEELAGIDEHLSACAACRQVVQGVAPDTFVMMLRSATTEPDSSAGAAPEPKAPPVPPIMDHPRYRVGALLGVGGMGAVYKAEHLLMERPVALKVLSRELTDKPETSERFRREVRAAARLTHPNIVAAFDAEQAGDVHFLVMEYVEGVSLARRLADHGPLPVAEACGYIRQAALGLQHAHERGMVHRDIKPQNLMLTPAGQVKILDFGLARFVMESVPAGAMLSAEATSPFIPSEEGKPLTQTGTVMGTPDYIAPEQARDSHLADIRADIYSLGCTLYDLLAGHAPFPEGSIAEKVKAHMGRTPRPLRDFRPDVSAELARVVDRMMAKDPADRFQTPAEVAETLVPFLGAAPKPPRRKKWLLPAALAGLVAALLAGVVIYVQTDTGTITIETNDDKIAVMIEKAGGVKIIDQTNKREYLLHPGAQDVPRGDYRLDVSEPLAGLDFQTKKFELKRGGEVRLTARFEPKSKGDNADAAIFPKQRSNDEDTLYRAYKAEMAIKARASRMVGGLGEPVSEVDFTGPTVTDADLKELAVLKSLQNLNLMGTQLTDAGLKELTGLNNLRGLGLSSTQVTDVGLKYLKALPSLRSLIMEFTRVTDAGMKDVAGLKGVETLGLDGTKVTDAGLKELAGLKNLHHLSLSDTQVTDVGLKELAGLKNLHDLDLSRTQVTDLGLKELKDHKSLRDLRLRATGVSDAGLKELAGLNNLQFLDLTWTKVTDAGAAELQKALPKCKIMHKDLKLKKGDVPVLPLQSSFDDETLYKGKPASFWLHQFKDANPTYRAEAVEALGSIAQKNKKLVPVLLAALKDNDSRVGKEASKALALFGPAIVPDLLEVLKDRASLAGIRSAAETLSRIGPDAKDAVPLLSQLLQMDNVSIRRSVISALGMIGPAAKPALPSMVALLGELLKQAEVQIGEIKDFKKGDRIPFSASQIFGATSTPALLKSSMLHIDPEIETLFPVETTTKMFASPLEKLRSDYAQWKQFYDALKRKYPHQEQTHAGAPTITSDSNSQPELARFAGTWSVTKEQILWEILPSSNKHVVFSGNSMTAMSDAKHIAHVSTFTIDPTTAPKTIDIHSSLPGSRKTNLGIYEFDDDTLKICVRVTGGERPASFVDTDKTLAIEFLKKVKAAGPDKVPQDQGPLFGGKPASFWLEQLKDANPKFRVEAVKALGGIAKRNKDLIPILRASLKDQATGVRLGAAQALGDLGPDAVPAMMEALKADDSTLQRQAIWALLHIGPGAKSAIPPMVELLGRVLKSDDVVVVTSSSDNLYGASLQSEIPRWVHQALKRIDPDFKETPPDESALRKTPDEAKQAVLLPWRKAYEELKNRYPAEPRGNGSSAAPESQQGPSSQTPSSDGADGNSGARRKLANNDH